MESSCELIKCSGPQDLVDRVSRSWLEELRLRQGQADVFSVALTGGRIAAQFYSALARAPGNELMTQLPLHFFWGDERCVPPDHPESNFAMSNSALLSPLRVPNARVHRIRGELPPARAAELAAADLRAHAQGHANPIPKLDWVFLSMGEDGHIASLFPGEPEDVRRDPALYRAVIGSKPPPHRITLGYGALAGAKAVWVLASGRGKEPALSRSLRDPGSTPLASLLQSRQRTRVYTDLLGYTVL